MSVKTWAEDRKYNLPVTKNTPEEQEKASQRCTRFAVNAAEADTFRAMLGIVSEQRRAQ